MKFKLYIPHLMYLLHFMYIIACKGWDLKPQIQLYNIPPFVFLWLAVMLSNHFVPKRAAFILSDCNVFHDCSAHLYVLRKWRCATLKSVSFTSSTSLQRSVTSFPHFHFTCYKNLHNFFFSSVDIIIGYFLFHF